MISNHKKILSIALIFLGILFILGLTLNINNKFTYGGSYYDNTSIITRLNVSNVGPVVHDVIVYDNNSVTNLILEQGTVHRIICNASVNDSNGWGDISNVNATIFQHPTYNMNSPNDYNYHYINSSCTQYTTVGATEAKYTCSFYVWYFAYNGTWICNVTAVDDSDAKNSSNDSVIIDPLYAINLSLTEVDFGELAPLEISSDRSVNVTNWGNMNLTIAVKGYGLNEGDNLSMDCQVGNISIGREKYSIASGTAYSSMTSLKSSFENITGLRVPFRVDDTDTGFINSTNSTYWKISPPLGTKGICNGTVVFSAVP